MKTTRYSLPFRVLSYAMIGLFGLMAVAGIAAYTLHSSNQAAQDPAANTDNLGPAPDTATAGNAVRPPTTPPVEVLATPPRELLAANTSSNSNAPSNASVPAEASTSGNANTPGIASGAVNRSASVNAPPAPPASTATTTIIRPPAGNVTRASGNEVSPVPATDVIRPPHSDVTRQVARTPTNDATRDVIHGSWTHETPAAQPPPIVASAPRNLRNFPEPEPAEQETQPVEVRRAIPVIHPTVRPPPSVTEQQIVEKLPDGRTRTTYIRTVRTRSATALTD